VARRRRPFLGFGALGAFPEREKHGEKEGEGEGTRREARGGPPYRPAELDREGERVERSEGDARDFRSVATAPEVEDDRAFFRKPPGIFYFYCKQAPGPISFLFFCFN